MRLYPLLAALLLASPALAEGEPKQPISHGAEAVILFGKLCGDTLADPVKAQDLLHQLTMEGTAEKMDQQKALGITGHASKEVWLLRGTTTLQPLLLDYAGKSCELSVNDADMKDIRAEFGGFIERFAAEEGRKLLGKQSNSITSDIAEDTAEVALPSGGSAALKLKARAKPENDTQHVLTLELKGDKV